MKQVQRCQEKNQNLSSYLTNEPLSAKSSSQNHYFQALNQKNKENSFYPVIRPNSTNLDQFDQPQRSYSSCNDLPLNYCSVRFPLRSGSQRKFGDQNVSSSPMIKKPLFLDKKHYVYYKGTNDDVEDKRKSNSTYSIKNVENLQKYQQLQQKISSIENKITSMKYIIDTSNLHFLKQDAKKINKLTSSTERITDKNNKSEFLNKKILTEVSESIGDIKKLKQNFFETNVQSKALQSTTLQLQKFVTQANPKTNKMPCPNKQVLTVKKIAMKAFDQVLEKQTSKKTDNDQFFKNKPPQTQFLYYISSVIKSFLSTESNKSIELTRDHMFQTIQQVKQMPYLIQIHQNIIDERKCFLKKKEYYKNKKTIIFDLDETLIHCNQSPQIPGDVHLPIRLPTGELIYASVNIRPYAMQILETLSKQFELIIFTASHGCYANVVIDYLDPEKKFVSHRLFRESCIPTQEGNYIKDLRVICNRDLKDVLIVDNATYSFGYQLGNGVPILPFYDDKYDQELIFLQNYLLTFKEVNDVREKNLKDLKLNRLIEFNDHLDFLQTLFVDQIPKQWL